MRDQPFGEILRELREARAVSMRALAAAADMDPAYLSRLETGKTGDAKQETVEKLAQALCTEAGLVDEDCDKLRRQLLEAAGHVRAKEDLLDDLAEQFAARLRDEGFPETQIDAALARVSLATMRAVLLGEERLEIGAAADYSAAEIAAREQSDEQVAEFSLEPQHLISELAQKVNSLPSAADESASSYLDRHAEDFTARRRRQRAQAQRVQGRSIRAGTDATIHVNKELTKDQDQQLRLIARLIKSLLQEK